MSPSAAAEVCAIVVTYRSAATVVACLGALRGAGGPGTVIVVDNASDDGTARLVAERFPHVRLIENASNVGFASACNRAARLTDAPLLLFLNPDAVPEPGAIGVLAEQLVDDPDAAVAGPLLLHEDGSLQTSAYRFPTLATELVRLSGLSLVIPRRLLRHAALRAVVPGTGHFDPHTALRAVDQVTGACMLVRRADFERVGGFDEGYFLYYEDIDLCRRLAALGRKVLHVPAARVMHFLGVSSAAAPATAARARHLSRIRYHDRYSGRVLSATVRAATALRMAADRGFGFVSAWRSGS